MLVAADAEFDQTVFSRGLIQLRDVAHDLA
jgi:hypothetical protein